MHGDVLLWSEAQGCQQGLDSVTFKSAEQSLGKSEAPESSEGLKGPDSGDRIALSLKASFKDLDGQILAEEQKQGVEKGAFGGCTAVVALVMGDVSPSTTHLLTSCAACQQACNFNKA